MLYKLAQKALFLADPETAHFLALEGLKVGRFSGATRLLCHTPDLSVECMGLTFPNPVGIAAGMDKNGDYIDALAALGFGFIEIGSVLPRPQEGNPKPRIFRLPSAQAMINRLGFNSKGVDYTVSRLQNTEFEGVLGINLGKNRDTPEESAAEDYCHCLEKIYSYASYVVINISSPNTPGLRGLQNAKPLEQLLASLNRKRDELEIKHAKRLPLVVKVAPDLDDEHIAQMAALFAANDVQGVIATNTTTSRKGVKGLAHSDEDAVFRAHRSRSSPTGF